MVESLTALNHGKQAGSLWLRFVQLAGISLPLIGGERRPVFGRRERALCQRAFWGARFMSSEAETARDRGRRLRAESTDEERKLRAQPQSQALWRIQIPPAAPRWFLLCRFLLRRAAADHRTRRQPACRAGGGAQRWVNSLSQPAGLSSAAVLEWAGKHRAARCARQAIHAALTDS